MATHQLETGPVHQRYLAVPGGQHGADRAVVQVRIDPGDAHRPEQFGHEGIDGSQAESPLHQRDGFDYHITMRYQRLSREKQAKRHGCYMVGAVKLRVIAFPAQSSSLEVML